MSKRQIIVTIDCEDERCGDCRGLDGETDNTWICPFADEVERNDEVFCVRGPLCMEAERKLRDLVESAQIAAHDEDTFTPHAERLLAALKEIER